MVKKIAFFLFILCGVTLLCRLGFWQLARAAEKENLLTQVQQAKIQQPLNKSALLALKPQQQVRFLPVQFQSEIDNQHAILLDNKTHKGQAGYHVLLPLQVDDKTIIFLNRGWLPLGKSREILPTIPSIIGEVTIEGSLDFAYRNPLISQAIESQKISWPLRMQQLDWELLSHLLGKNIIPMIITLKANSPLALAITPKEEEMMTPARHIGYAVQWFALAATFFLFCVFSYYKRSKP